MPWLDREGVANVETISDEGGCVYQGSNAIHDVVVESFQRLLTASKDHVIGDELLDFILQLVVEGDNEDLLRPFSEEET